MSEQGQPPGIVFVAVHDFIGGERSFDLIIAIGERLANAGQRVIVADGDLLRPAIATIERRDIEGYFDPPGLRQTAAIHADNYDLTSAIIEVERTESTGAGQLFLFRQGAIKDSRALGIIPSSIAQRIVDVSEDKDAGVFLFRIPPHELFTWPLPVSDIQTVGVMLTLGEVQNRSHYTELAKAFSSEPVIPHAELKVGRPRKIRTDSASYPNWSISSFPTSKAVKQEDEDALGSLIEWILKSPQTSSTLVSPSSTPVYLLPSQSPYSAPPKWNAICPDVAPGQIIPQPPTNSTEQHDEFLNFLSLSISVNKDEKSRIISAVGNDKLSREQFVQLVEILREERVKFQSLNSGHQDQLWPMVVGALWDWVKLLREDHDLFEAGRLDAIKRLLEDKKALGGWWEEDKFFLSLAQKAMEESLDDAFAIIEAGLNHRPTAWRLLETKGRFLASREDNEKALVTLEEAQKNAPAEYLKLPLLFSDLLLRCERVGEARHVLEEILQKASSVETQVESLNRLGWIAIHEEEWQQAQEYYIQLVDVAEDDSVKSEALKQLVETALQTEDVRAAGIYAREYLKTGEWDVDSLTNIAARCFHLGHDEFARSAYQTAVSQKLPTSLEDRVLLAELGILLYEPESELLLQPRESDREGPRKYQVLAATLRLYNALLYGLPSAAKGRYEELKQARGESAEIESWSFREMKLIADRLEARTIRDWFKKILAAVENNEALPEGVPRFQLTEELEETGE